ncbi:glycosyltransferase, partial [Chloroflexota bacterium]
CPVGMVGTQDTGGMSVCIRELAGELGKQGHTVDIYTRTHDPAHGQVMELAGNVRLIHLKAGDNEYVNKLAVYLHLPDFACALEGFRNSQNMDYDLVFSHYWLSGWVGNLLQGWWRIPHIITFHTLGAVKNAVGIGEDEPELRIETERYLIKSCNRIFTATERGREDIIRHYGSTGGNIRVVPCGVNLEMFSPENKKAEKQPSRLPERKKILFVGRIEPLKGIDNLLKAASILKKRHDIEVIIIGGDGNSQYMQYLQGLSGDLNITDSIRFLGLVGHEELPGYYNAADVCVVPSYYESFGLVTLESLACGTPVVATDVGSAGSVIHPGINGYRLEDNSPQRLADNIDKILSVKRTDKDRISIRETVAGNGWANMAGAIDRECREVIKEYSGSRV